MSQATSLAYVQGLKGEGGGDPSLRGAKRKEMSSRKVEMKRRQ